MSTGEHRLRARKPSHGISNIRSVGGGRALLVLAAGLLALIGALVLFPRPAEAQSRALWSGTLTVDVAGGNSGCGAQGLDSCSTALTVGGFSYMDRELRIFRLFYQGAYSNIVAHVSITAGADAARGGAQISVPWTLRIGSNSYRITYIEAIGPRRYSLNGVDLQAPVTNPDWSDGDELAVSVTVPAPAPAAAGGADPTLRSWPLTEIADEGATEWWFPIGRGKCDMKDEIRPWTWKRWKPPTADRCGWLSIPDVRAGLAGPVDELAVKVYTALVGSPEISGPVASGRPTGPSVKLAVWAVYPHPERSTNSTRRLEGPHDPPITVCLPGGEGQAIHGFDEEQGKWLKLKSVESEREGQICGLHRHDLGLLVVGRAK